MIEPLDWALFKEWAQAGHYDNGDYTLIDRVMKELIQEHESRSAKPHQARLSSAQRNLLEFLCREGETYFKKESRTLKSLIKRGLVESRWKPPQPGNDYGGTMRYRLSEAGFQEVIK